MFGSVIRANSPVHELAAGFVDEPGCAALYAGAAGCFVHLVRLEDWVRHRMTARLAFAQSFYVTLAAVFLYVPLFC